MCVLGVHITKQNNYQIIVEINRSTTSTPLSVLRGLLCRMGLIEVREQKVRKKPDHTNNEKIKVLNDSLLIYERLFCSLAVQEHAQASVSLEI